MEEGGLCKRKYYLGLFCHQLNYSTFLTTTKTAEKTLSILHPVPRGKGLGVVAVVCLMDLVRMQISCAKGGGATCWAHRGGRGMSSGSRMESRGWILLIKFSKFKNKIKISSQGHEKAEKFDILASLEV